MSKQRCIMVGAGGMANWLSRNFLPPFKERLEIAALVDVNTEALKNLGDYLEVPASGRFTDQEKAFADVEADFCMIITPPAVHEDTVKLATQRCLPIFSEKPVADTWEACVRIYKAVKQTNTPMMVVQNYRYNAPVLTFKQVLNDQRLGQLNYLVGRFAADYRNYGSWGVFRHEIPHALLVEGSVHHLDQLRNLAGADCTTITGWEWNPSWSSFKGSSNGMYLMKFENDVVAHYEGSCNAAAHQNNWHNEYYRAECEWGAVFMDTDQRVWLEEYTPSQGARLTEVPNIHVEFQGHCSLVKQFLDWLEGGPEPVTVIDDNIRSVAMMFGAIEASETGQTVDVRAKVAAAMGI